MKSLLYTLYNRPGHAIASIVRRLWFLFPNDKLYLSIIYYLEIGHRLNLHNPQSFTEKLQWLKLHDRNPKYIRMVDKVSAKEYVADIIGEDYIIPTLGVWKKFDDIDFSSLPHKFVLKCNHGGGGSGIIICHDKNHLDKNKARRILESTLKNNCYPKYREWPYKDIKPLIFAEKLLEEQSDLINDHCSEVLDYKFFCFDGKVKFYKIDFGRFTNHHANYYSPDGEFLGFSEEAFPSDKNANITIPKNLDHMIQLAEKLAEGHMFLRVDFYNCMGAIYFGELTFYPASGFGRFTPDSYDKEIGKLLRIPNTLQ